MKIFKVAIVVVLLIIMALPALAQRRKTIKDAKALLTSAKIAMLANPPRYDEAMELITQVLVDNGPVAEAFFRRGNIFAGHATNEYNLPAKYELVKKMVYDFDSLQYTCDNEDIKKKFRKNCKDFIKDSDSVRVYFWRENYNEGINIISNIENVHQDNLNNAGDSSSEAAAQSMMDAAVDSSILYFQMAYTVDPDNPQPLTGIGIVYDRIKNYDSSAYWFSQAFEKSDDEAKTELSQNIAYAYLNSGDWSSSIEWLNKYLEFNPNDVGTLSNIAVAYTNQKNYDSAFSYNQKILAIEPTNAGACFDVGTYFLIKSQELNEQLTESRKTGTKEEIDVLQIDMDDKLDSASSYFKAAVDNAAEDDNNATLYLEQHALLAMITGDYDVALEAYRKVIELNPNKEAYISVGDILVQKGIFCEAIEPYEKAIEEDPGDDRLWEVLGDLYESCKMPDKSKAAREKVEELRNM